jgi:hypothetical protein
MIFMYANNDLLHAAMKCKHIAIHLSLGALFIQDLIFNQVTLFKDITQDNLIMKTNSIMNSFY